jgi:hypothetical protein
MKSAYRQMPGGWDSFQGPQKKKAGPREKQKLRH